ncbi:MAG: hypothetical protein ACJZ1Q_07255 [Candidatus Neomarinimicrobiota bacterium]|tara:strand:+ start:59 stop:436 length:378 start_codon:yes stop_codon:yes gene_type:complete
MNWKIIRSLIPIIGLWIIINSSRNLTKEYEPTEPILSTSGNDLVWRFQVNEGQDLIGKTVQISGKATGLDSNYVTIDNRVYFLRDTLGLTNLKLGEEVNITARCANFNEKIGVVEVDFVTILNHD